jgi:hypothetical protein
MANSVINVFVTDAVLSRAIRDLHRRQASLVRRYVKAALSARNLRGWITHLGSLP